MSLASRRALREPDASTLEMRLTHYCMKNGRRLDHRKALTLLPRFDRGRYGQCALAKVSAAANGI